MLRLSKLRRFQIAPNCLFTAVDFLATGLAASLPWSTSATAILVGLFVIALVPTINVPSFRNEILTWSSGLPVVLCLLACLGTLWADIPLKERVSAIEPLYKLLVIPLLIYHFRRSDRAALAFNAFLISCVALLMLSFAIVAFPNTSWAPRTVNHGVPFKDHISQGVLFSICVYCLFDLALTLWIDKARALAVAVFLLACAFLGNILFVLENRTALVEVAVLGLAFIIWRFGFKAQIILILIGLVFAGSALAISSSLRNNVTAMFREANATGPESQHSRAGERLVLWKGSLKSLQSAPLLGHGTGTISSEFQKQGIVSTNPHNQTFWVGIQWGLLGIVLLWAMWISQIFLFCRVGTIAWIGFIVVLGNIVDSFFNSHISDFTQGWLYVVGVGIAGGAMMRKIDGTAVAEPAALGRTPVLQA